MRIVIGKVSSASKNPLTQQSTNYRGHPAPSRERRKRKQDRRKSVRDGVIVRLSFKHDRRNGRDRRKA
jgi:hypothetical protein